MKMTIELLQFLLRLLQATSTKVYKTPHRRISDIKIQFGVRSWRSERKKKINKQLSRSRNSCYKKKKKKFGGAELRKRERRKELKEETDDSDGNTTIVWDNTNNKQTAGRKDRLMLGRRMLEATSRCEENAKALDRERERSGCCERHYEKKRRYEDAKKK